MPTNTEKKPRRAPKKAEFRSNYCGLEVTCEHDPQETRVQIPPILLGFRTLKNTCDQTENTF